MKTYHSPVSPVKTRSESCEQIDCMNWLAKNYPERFDLCFHCANEVKANAQYMQKRAQIGVKSGVPDIVDVNGRITGFFELKKVPYRDEKGRINRNTVSKSQREFLEKASKKGHFCAVCYGFEQFKVAYLEFLALTVDERIGAE